ncbi:GNAT family N-acetyltransferase [Halosimplex amylolyticum]|uniref:GNAT family N-acetyltransferase n=1 Tax=Halosimplex amylolyticum TaxID=3396616 RepID=UPI003F57A64D
MPDLTIRRYDADDEEAVWTLHERALRDAGAYDEEYAHLDADLRNVESEYLDAGGEFLVGEVERSATLDGERGGMPGERDSDVVAMGALQPSTDVDHHESDRDAAVVRRMRVDPGHQRRGHGSRILRELETCAADRGFEQLVLDTTPRQEAATALYESFGFREARREETPVGEMIFYTKEL